MEEIHMRLPEFDKIEKESITSKVYSHIKESILSGAIASGAHLLEAQIAKQMGISRAPVREAFLQLEADGLVEVKANQGTFVRDLSGDEVWEIYTARCLIEGYAASLAAKRANPEDIEHLRQAMDEVLNTSKKGDYQTTVVADFKMHRLIWQISGHKIICEILERLENQIRMFMAVQAPLFEHLYDSVKDHKGIFECIARGDSEAARSSIEAHILEAGKMTVARLKQTKQDNNE
jgi:DNA-binding GntR family transcriptional regulator